MAYTGYNTRFFFRFASQAGREFRIDIKKRGFTGTAEQRPVGRTPVLKRETGDKGILGTSLEIYAECKTDGEFAELYTSDAKRYLVILSSVNGNTVTPIWTGFISPELYSEPEIAPPYDVQIIATDGLGELKLHNFEPAGRVSLYTHLFNLLSFTGLNVAQSDIVLINSLHSVTPSITQSNLLASTYVDLDYLAETGANCYDALSAIMATLNLTITRYEDRWLIMRESDVEVSGNAIIGQISGGSSISLPVVQYNSMRRSRWYPVGRMETEVVPAKNAVRVTYPFQMRESMFTNPNLPDGTGWTYPTQQPNVDHYVRWIGIGGGERRPILMNSSTRGSCSIYQDINVEAYEGKLTLRILTMLYSVLSAQTYSVFFKLRLTATGATYYLKKKDLGESYEWVTSENEVEYKEERLSGYTSTLQIPVSSFRERSFDIPGLPASGTLRIEITSKSKNFSLWYKDEDFYIGGVYLLQDAVPGYRDDIIIDNAARGSADDVDMVFGDTQYVANALKNFHNILSDSNGTPCTEWETSKYSGELLSVIAMDYAGDVALPRLKARGTINVPVNASLPVAFVNPDGISMVIRTFDWSLCDDNINVELISVSAVEMEITSETITEITPDEAISAGGSGGTSSGGAGGTGGRSSDKFFEAIDDSGETGALAIYDLYINQVPGSDEPQIKDISKILRHLSLQVVDEGLETERTVLVCDISLGSQLAVFAGGIGTPGGGGGGGSLATLNDVALSSLADGQILRYNALTSHWENKTLTLALSALTDVAIGTPTNGQVLKYNSSSQKWVAADDAGGIASVVLAPGTNNGTLKLTVDGAATDNIAVKGLGDLAYLSAVPAASNNAIGGFKTGYSGSGKNYAVQLNNSNQAFVNVPWASGIGSVSLATGTNNGTLKLTVDGSSTDNIAVKGLGDLAFLSSIPAATDSAYGGFKTGYNGTGKNYAVQLSSGKAYVNVPWTDTVYIHPTYTATTIAAGSGKVLSAITVDSLGHVSSVSSKTLAAGDIPALDYLPTSGGTLTGDLRIQNGTHGRSLFFGDGSFVYLNEDADDHLKIYAKNGLQLVAGSGYGIALDNSVTIAGDLTVGGSSGTSACKIATFYGRTSASYPALKIYGVASSSSSYVTNIYRDSSYLQIDSGVKVTGNLLATGAVTAGAASDRRLKKNIKAINQIKAEELLSALNPVIFEWNDDAARLGHLFGVSRGFLADEYLKVLPNAGRKIWDKYDAIDYNQVIPYLVAGWQRQNLTIRTLEGDIKSLKSDNELLRRRLREANVLH